MTEARVLQLNVSDGGVPKTSISIANVVPLGIVGDKQRYRYHGGPQKALLLLASEVIDSLQKEGWPVFWGALGENITTLDLDHRTWRTGQRYQVGSVLLQLTEPRVPCSKLDPYGPGIQKRIFDKQVKALDASSLHWGESGFYAAVLRPGSIEVNDTIKVIDQVV
ncbi:MAG: MOSC domain-containing protein [Acidobacteriota bacterium]|nr:MOSC domain-containing protein [Acidobacteriota bacterium]